MFKSVDIIRRALQEPIDLINAINNDNKLQGLLIESQFFKLFDGEFTNSNGYDGIINGKNMK